MEKLETPAPADTLIGLQTFLSTVRWDVLDSSYCSPEISHLGRDTYIIVADGAWTSLASITELRTFLWDSDCSMFFDVLETSESESLDTTEVSPTIQEEMKFDLIIEMIFLCMI